MELAAVKSGSKKGVLSEADIAANKSMLDKWLNEQGSLLSDANSTIKEKQQHAAEKFIHAGLPGRKSEDYKYTHIRSYLNENYCAAGNTIVPVVKDIEMFLHDDFISIVLVNGKFLPEYSRLKNLPKGVTVRSLFKALEDGDEVALKYFNSTLEHTRNPLALLNTAIAGDGIFISIPDNLSCQVPLHLANISMGEDKTFCNPRNLVYVSRNSEVTLIESYHSLSENKNTFFNSVTEFVVEENAKLENYILQDETINSYRNDVHQFSVGKDSVMNSVSISLNGGLVRNDANVLIEGEHAEAHLNGLFIVKENCHTDNHTMVEHRVPNCFSNELYKGIIADNGTGVFNGKILVYHDAQKTNAYQSNKNILMGDKATINTKPQLEIYADDVRCTHGTSTGKLDEEALFYMETRGLNEKLAKKILLQSFAKEVSNTIKNEPFRTLIEQKIEENIQ